MIVVHSKSGETGIHSRHGDTFIQTTPYQGILGPMMPSMSTISTRLIFLDSLIIPLQH